MKRKSVQSSLIVMLCILALLLSACGSANSQDEAVVNEDVQLSNIRFPDMDLTAEEKKMMQEVRTILENAEYVVGAERNDQNTLKIENTSTQTLEISFIVNSYKDGDVLSRGDTLSLDEWKPGERVEARLGYSDGEELRAEIMAEYVSGSSYYRTESIPLRVTETEKETAAVLSVKGGLPQNIKTSSWKGDSVYELTSFEYEEEDNLDDKYDFVMLFTKISGKAQGIEQIEYRIIGEDGTIAHSDSISFYYIKTGETVRATDTYIGIPAGTYSIEFLSAS